MKKSKFVLLLSASMLLASCGGNNPAESASSSGTSVSSGASSSSSSSSTSEEEGEKYVIRVNVSSGVHITLSKQSAGAGEDVTFTVTLDTGYVLKNIYVNNAKVTPNSSGVYAFVMPNQSVTITADVEVDGEVRITGDIAVKLEEEDVGSGLYVARNVRVDSKAVIQFEAFGNKLSMTDIDDTKCLADIGSPSAKGGAFSIAGGASYDFFYDDNADIEGGRIYVRRVKVNTLPSDPNSLLSLFDGLSRSNPTQHPENLLSVEYRNGITDVAYEWDNYLDGSLGVAKKDSNNASIGVNYRKIDEDVYYEADTYVEYSEHKVPGSSESKHSGRYGIVDKAENIQYGRYQVSSHDAEFEAHKQGHSIYAMRFDLMDSFYIGFDTEWTDGLGLNERVITSSENDNGFDVTISSYREIDTTNVLNATETEVAYYKYDATLSFDEAGQFLSATYLGKRFGSDAYSFASHSIIDPDNYTLVADMEATYTYGSPLSKINYDASSLFSSSIGATITDENVKDASLKQGNHIAVSGDSSDDTFNAHMTLSSSLGEDFLDINNYTIIAYDNPDIVSPRTSSDPFTLLPIGAGTVNLTIGNPAVASAPRITIEVAVEDAITIRSFYLIGEDGLWTPSNDLLTTATSFTMPTGKIYRFRALGSVGDVKNVPFTPVSSRPDLLEVERYVIDNQAYIKFDATAAHIDAVTKVNVTLESDRYNADSLGPTVIEVTLTPGTSFSPYGEFYKVTSFDESSDTWLPTAVDKNVVANIKEYDANTPISSVSSITITNGSTSSVYEFAFHYNDESGLSTWSRVDNGNVSELSIAETVDGLLGIALVADDAVWGGQDDYTDGTSVLGSFVYDDEGQLEEVYYDSFDLKSNWDN